MTNNQIVLTTPSIPTGIYAKMQQLNQTKTLAQYQQEIAKTVFTPNLPPGSYYAVSNDAVYEENVTTKKGKSSRVVVTYTVYVPVPNQTEKEVEFRQLYYKSTNTKSPYVWQLSTLLGHDSKQGFRISDLIGIPCAIEVKHDQKEDGNTYAEIVSLQKLPLPSVPSQITI